ncbi:MAG: hypothetical protein JKY53_11825 [Flavobacteriales bacterium]|nr:hypothetical protein [Flavobacteriales bacterium]
MIKIKILAIIVVILAFVSCSDIFEKDLAKESIIVLGPNDLTETYTLNQTFWWGDLKGADEYNLQIVSPSFDAPIQWLLDSNTVATKYPFTLSPGNYQWRIRAENGSSSTEYIIRTLTILSDSTQDLSNQIMVLNSPINSLVTNQLTLTFMWDTLTYANDYVFEITTPDFVTGTKESQIETNGTASYTAAQEGNYQWRVRAQNDISFLLSESFSLLIDTTAPNRPASLLPINNASMTDSTISFSWSQGANTGSSLFDSIFIYTDSTFISSSLMLKQQLSSPNFADSLGGPNTYYWLVRTYDIAGNQSSYSNYNRLDIQ